MDKLIPNTNPVPRLIPRKKLIVTGDDDTAEVLIVALDATDPFSPHAASTMIRLAIRKRSCDCHIHSIGELDPRSRTIGFVVNLPAREVLEILLASFDCNWIHGTDPRGRFLALGEWN